MRIELFLIATGWSYQIVDENGMTVIYQEYDPDLPGNAPMTKTVAQAKAEIALARLNN